MLSIVITNDGQLANDCIGYLKETYIGRIGFYSSLRAAIKQLETSRGSIIATVIDAKLLSRPRCVAPLRRLLTTIHRTTPIPHLAIITSPRPTRADIDKLVEIFRHERQRMPGVKTWIFVGPLCMIDKFTEAGENSASAPCCH